MNALVFLGFVIVYIITVILSFSCYFAISLKGCDGKVANGVHTGILVCAIFMLLFPCLYLYLWCTSKIKKGANDGAALLFMAAQFSPLVEFILLIVLNAKLNSECSMTSTPAVIYNIVMPVPLCVLLCLFFIPKLRVTHDVYEGEKDANGNVKQQQQVGQITTVSV